MSKKGQVTIFIILAIIIVVAIILVFSLRGKVNQEPSITINPTSKISSCVRSIVEEEINSLIPNAGIKNPSRTIMYQDENYSYLCYHGDFERNCINMYPFLDEKVEKEIFENTKNEVEDCIQNTINDFESDGFTSSTGNTAYSISILPGIVRINLEKKVTLTKGDNAQNFEDFSSEFNSPLHSLLTIASEVVKREASECDFDSTFYSLLNPSFEIRKSYYRESNLYKIKSRETNEEIKFAVRSCVSPAGVLII